MYFYRYRAGLLLLLKRHATETHQSVQFLLLGLDHLHKVVDLLLVVVELEQLLLELAVHLVGPGRACVSSVRGVTLHNP